MNAGYIRIETANTIYWAKGNRVISVPKGRDDYRWEDGGAVMVGEWTIVNDRLVVHAETVNGRYQGVGPLVTSPITVWPYEFSGF